MLTRLPHSEAIDARDGPPSKALDSNIFTPSLLTGQLADPRIQLFPGDLLNFSPSSHPDDLLSHQYDGNIVDAFMEYPFDNRCLDSIQDVWGFNGESPDSGSWSLESTPSLVAPGLSPFSNVDDLSPPCTPNTGIPLPDFCDEPNDNNPPSTPPLLSSSPLLSTDFLPSLFMSPACSQVSLDPASAPSLLFSSDDPEAAAYVQNVIQDVYEARQPVSPNVHFPPHGPHISPSCGQGPFSHSSPCSDPICFVPPEILLSPTSEIGRSSIWTDTINHPSDELEESGYRFPHILHQSLDEAKWTDGCLPPITYVATMGQSEHSLKHRRPVNAVEAPMSSMGYIDDVTISTRDKKRRKTDNTISFPPRACAVVSSTSYKGDAETSMMGDVQRHQADSATDSPIRGLPCLPLNTSVGGLGRQPSKGMQTGRERVSSKKTSRVRKEAVPSKVSGTPTRGGISDQSRRPASSPPGASSSVGSSASSPLGGMVFKIGSRNVSAASQLRRKHKEVFQCNFAECQSTFTKRHNLKIHMERHMGVLYPCPGCKHPYAQEASMNRHKKNCKQVQPNA